jgi:dCTP diphosphatase
MTEIWMQDSLQTLTKDLRRFAQARDWEQFHTPKNLATALMVEAGEIAEHFQWLTAEQSASLDPQARDEVALEIADVLIYLMRLSDVLGIDPVASAWRKIEINKTRFPERERTL